MIGKLIIWMQFIAASLLAADAVISKEKLIQLNSVIRKHAEHSNRIYEASYLKRDATYLVIFIAATVAVYALGQVGPVVSEFLAKYNMFSIGLVFLLIWSVLLLLVFSFAVRAFTENLDKAPNLLIKYPFFMLLYKAPKGPIYTLGFILLVASYLLLLLKEYGYIA